MQLYSQTCPLVAAAKAKLLGLIKSGTPHEVCAANREYVEAIRQRNAEMRTGSKSAAK